MRILLPTGAATETLVRRAAAGYDADVVVTGEIASFLTPHALRMLLKEKKYDCVIISGMCTASFEQVEHETGIPVYRGPRHAADLTLVLPLIGTETFSRTVPADDFLAARRARTAMQRIEEHEREAVPDFLVRGIKIGGGSRMKVLAEIMDAPRQENIREMVERFFAQGADIVDLGFGFDATQGDVRQVFSDLDGIDRPLAADTQDPDLIRAALVRADLILSLQEENIPRVGKAIAKAGIAAVVVPGQNSLAKNIAMAKAAGIRCLVADPLLRRRDQDWLHP